MQDISFSQLQDITPESVYYASYLAYNSKYIPDDELRILMRPSRPQLHFDLQKFLGCEARKGKITCAVTPQNYPILLHWNILICDQRKRSIPNWLRGTELEEFWWRAYFESHLITRRDDDPLPGYLVTRPKPIKDFLNFMSRSSSRWKSPRLLKIRKKSGNILLHVRMNTSRLVVVIHAIYKTENVAPVYPPVRTFILKRIRAIQKVHLELRDPRRTD